MRPELLAVLNDSAHARLVTVVAGTGYGKSVLLALWRADPDRTRALAVLAADALDDDPVVFWSKITASLAAAVPRQEWEQVRRLLTRQTPDLAGLVLPTLLSALAAAGPVTLAIDDLHRVANPDCNAQLSWLVTHLPAGCQVLLASRVPPGMAVARLRAAADLTELGPGQLRLSWAQAAELIGGVAGAALPASMLDRLLAVTEGWPAAVYLAARTLRAHPDPRTLLARLGAARGHLADLFAEEVTGALHDGHAQALVRSSILDRFTADLCREVTGTDLLAVPGAASDLFLVPLDENGTWFRHHHLIQAVLWHRLQQAEPGLVPDLHRRAAAWLARHDLPGEAIGHALAAGDAATATDLAASLGPDRSAQAGRMPGSSPWPTVDALLLRARTCLAMGDYAAVHRFVSAAEDLLGQLPGPAARSRVQRPSRTAALTETEHALLRMLPTQLSLSEIARQRHVSINTVKTQSRAVYRKLGATGRNHAVGIARDLGLIP